MKLINSFIVTAFAFVVLSGSAIAAEGKKQSCCDKAKEAGKECAHPCCVEAAKEKKVCAKCNKTDDKKKEETK